MAKVFTVPAALQKFAELVPHIAHPLPTPGDSSLEQKDTALSIDLIQPFKAKLFKTEKKKTHLISKLILAPQLQSIFRLWAREKKKREENLLVIF